MERYQGKETVITVLCLAALWPSAPLLVANEITSKDGTKFVGRVTSITFENVEVDTSDGRIQLRSTDPESIRFRQGLSTQSTEANTVKADLPKIDESLNGTEYVNRTGKFSLTLPRSGSSMPTCVTGRLHWQG